jgi:predicted HicB family RNase H-like nuclease
VIRARARQQSRGRAGRPRKIKGDQLNFKLRDGEHAAFTDAAAAANLSLSEWARQRLRAAAGMDTNAATAAKGDADEGNASSV